MSVHFLNDFPIDQLQDSSKYEAIELVDVLHYFGKCCNHFKDWGHMVAIIRPLLVSTAGTLSSFKVGQTFSIMVSPPKALIPPIQQIFFRHGVEDTDNHVIFSIGGLDLRKRLVTAEVSPEGYGGEAVSKQFSKASIFNIPDSGDIHKVFTGMTAVQPTNLPLPTEWKDKVLVLSFTKSREDSDSESSSIIGMTAITYSCSNPDDVRVSPGIFLYKEVEVFFDNLKWLHDSATVLEDVDYPFPENLVDPDSMTKYLYELWANDQKFEEIRNANSSSRTGGVLVA